MKRPGKKCLLIGLAVLAAAGIQAGQTKAAAIPVPEVKGWEQADEPRTFLPETLFEYIDGAAESYLGYDFKELRVFQFKGREKASLTVEVYDMGNSRNAFGIFSVERSPEGRPVPMGLQGYQEEGTLNFLTGPYYVKLICYDAGENTTSSLESFAREVEKRAGDKGSLPPIIGVFPKEGLVERSEKFILRNFLGYNFLHDGFAANYRVKDLEFDCFFIEARNEEEAAGMLKQYLAALAKNNQAARKTASGYHARDKYALNVYLGRAGRVICGVMRVKDGVEAIGEKYCSELQNAVLNLKL